MVNSLPKFIFPFLVLFRLNGFATAKYLSQVTETVMKDEPILTKEYDFYGSIYQNIDWWIPTDMSKSITKWKYKD